jgi:outer membrane protein assembly factor BamB
MFRYLVTILLFGLPGTFICMKMAQSEASQEKQADAVNERPRQEQNAGKAEQNPAQTDWPLFRGNLLQTGTVTAALPDKLEVLWKVSFGRNGDIESTAAIVGDTVYVGTFDEHLYALELGTGKEKWKYKATDVIKAPVSVSDGAVYVGDDSGMFHCVDAKTGKERWTFATNGEIAGGASFTGERVLFGSHDSTLYCLEKKNGALVWKFKTQGPVNGSALVAEKLGLTFVAGCDSELHIVDLKTGKGVAAIGLNGQAAATAAVLGDKLYVGTMTNDFFEVDLVKKAIAWAYSPPNVREFFSSAAVTDKLVLVGNRDKMLHALDRKTGNVAWTFAAKNRIDSSPVVAGEKVYFGSSDGNLYVVNLANGTLVQKLELGRGILASAAVSQGRLVIGTTDGHLYCLGKK